MSPELSINVWRFDPSIVLGLLALIGAYTSGALYLQRQGRWGAEITARHVAFFAIGVFVLVFALISPIDYIGENYLFSIHMVQHILLAMVAPALILLGIPRWMMQWVLDVLRIGWLVRWVSNPIVAFIAFNTALIAWHFPALYEAALRDPIVHIAEHLFFISTGFLSWYPVVDPARQHPAFHPPVKVLYLFLFVIPSGVLGAVIAFAPQPLYAAYAAAPRLWGLGVMDDQAIAGGIMWVPGWAIYFVALSIVFAAWMRREEQVDNPLANQPTNQPTR
jgi:putative membrane protein